MPRSDDDVMDMPLERWIAEFAVSFPDEIVEYAFSSIKPHSYNRYMN